MPANLTLQTWLDASADATMAGDWQTYSGLVSLPFHLVTETASMAVETEADLRRGFDQFREMLLVQRVTDYIRLAESAAEIGPDLIAGRYVTHLMSGATRILAPYRSQVTLRRDGDGWRAVSIVNALVNTHWPIALPVVGTHFDGRKETP